MGVIDSFLAAIGQLPERRLRGVLGIGIAGALAVFAVVWSLAWWGVAAIDWTGLPLIGWLFKWMGDWAEWLGSVAFGTAALIGTFVLFPAVITIIVGFFLERVVQAVEEKYYPNEPAPRPQPVSEVLISTVRFALVVIGVNLIALPFYVLFLFLFPLNLVLYYLINGYLVSREYYELVALRRLSPRTARRLRRAHRSRLLFAGVILVFVMTIPLVNFVTPVLAAAFMVHVYQNLPRRLEFAQATA